MLSYLFRIRFRAKRLSGGYLAINKSQLVQLPIRQIAPGCARQLRLRRKLEDYVAQMLDACRKPDSERRGGESHAVRQRRARIDAAIDRLVYQLYDLSDEETARVESSFDVNHRTSRRAA